MTEIFRPCAVIPVYNHAATVSRVVQATSRRLEPVLVIDDGSTDGSGEAARAAGAEVIRHEANLGKGAALKTAFAEAARRGFTHVVTLDADGQHDPVDIPILLSEARAHPDAVVVGNRRMAGTGAPTGNRIGRHISNFWVALEGLVYVADAQCGYRVYPIGPVNELPLKSPGYELEIEVLVRAARRGLPVRNVPVQVVYEVPEGRVTHFDQWRDNLRISKLNAGLCFSLIPELPAVLFNRLGREAPAFPVLALETAFRITRLIGVEPARRVVMAPTLGFFFLRSTATRRVLLAYARRRLPSAGATAHLSLAWQAFHRFGESLFERMLRTQGIWEREWDQDHGEEGVERIRQALDRGKGAVLVTAHVGRWAEAAEILIAAGLDPVLVMNRSEADAFTRAQERASQPLPQIEDASAGTATGLRLLKRLRRGELIAVMGDRLAGDAGVAVDLLGSLVRLPLGPFLLAATAGAPWFAVGGFVQGEDHIRTLVDGPFEARKGRKRDAASAEAGRFATVLEAWLERYPDQWFNFEDPWEQAAQY